MHPFERYLQQHDLEPLFVSLAAKVRYITVWNAMKGNPITADHAQRIKQAVFYLTKVPYTGEFLLIQQQPEPVDQFPILPIRKMSRRF